MMKFATAYAGQVVCVAGAGGYIGSTLVKALAPAGLKSLVLVDTSEYGLFEIERWIQTEYPAASYECVLGSVDDARLLDDVFSRLHPQTVFHAAAFKHVGLLENNPFAAIRNNALATYTFAQAAPRHGVARFILISTDKAANPHGVMGVSKRIAELFTLSFDCTNVIRLGNVIGSPGGVIPLFLEQIEKSQPLSVTHRDASRYFLSKDETVMSILAAGLANCEGKVLLPKFNDPVRIADLARFLIGARTLPIHCTGLKPGEKLTEDLIGRNERKVGLIDGPLTVVETNGLSRAETREAVHRLSTAVADRDADRLLEALCTFVPEYVPSRLALQCLVSA
jgi:FlaA1/EpsC-like NDP-sugar epimerase